jgi:hypothetical protein
VDTHVIVVRMECVWKKINASAYLVNMKKKKTKIKKPKKIKEKEKKVDHYGLGKAFMKMSDFLFGKGWNTNK